MKKLIRIIKQERFNIILALILYALITLVFWQVFGKLAHAEYKNAKLDKEIAIQSLNAYVPMFTDAELAEIKTNFQVMTNEYVEVIEEENELLKNEMEALAKTVWGEAKGCTVEEQRLVIWCVFNRVDEKEEPILRDLNTIYDVVSYITPNLPEGVDGRAFHGYNETYPIQEDILILCYEEYEKWQAGEEAPILEPYAITSEYLYFHGDGKHNWYREVF